MWLNQEKIELVEDIGYALDDALYEIDENVSQDDVFCTELKPLREKLSVARAEVVNLLKELERR